MLLKEKRIKLSLTQQQFAKMIGVSRTTYTNIELGEKNPSLNVALKIKQILKTNNDDIFLDSNEPKGNNQNSA
jgi:putative transcriptional regulator